MLSKLYIIVPAYNEEKNIERFVNDWYPIVCECNLNGGGIGSRLLIINDGSTDRTLEILEKCKLNRPLLEVIDKTNSGHGATLIHGYKYALEHGAEYIFQTDSDGQTLPEEFWKFWQLRDEYDAILGNRPVRGDGESRKFVENTLRFILRIIFGVKVPDANAPFRLMNRAILEKYLAKIPENFNLPNVMLTTYFAYFSENVKFLDITFRPRQGGKNFINVRRIVKIGLRAVRDFLILRLELKRDD